MRVLGAAVAVLGFLVPAPAPAFADPAYVAPVAVATPAVVEPGQRIHFGLDCGRPVRSAWLTMVTPAAMGMRRSGPQRFELSLRVPAGAKPGRYHVDMRCAGGESALAAFDVVEAPRATGAVNPRVGRRGQPVNFGLACPYRVGAAALKGRSLGLRHDVALSPSGTGVFGATVDLPRHLARGRYHVNLKCADGHAIRVVLRVR